MNIKAEQSCSGDYRIRVGGHLSPCWAERLGGFAIVHADTGETLLYGRVADQSALHGVLRTLRDTGMTLIGVERVHP